MKNKDLILSLAIISTLILSSCKKFVSVSVPEDRVISNRVFADDNKATSAVTAIYGNMINGASSFTNFYTTLYGGMSSDELAKFNASVNELEFINNSLTPSNAVVSAIWKSAYQSIYYTNAVLEGLENSQGVTSATKKQLIGETRFIRAFCYFYLANFFGDVPLITTTDYRINSVLPRSPVENVYDLIISDLTEAKEGLAIAYVAPEKTRPNKLTAMALLSRVYLYKKDWLKAELTATEVIASGMYTPLPSLANVFLKTSKEAIWQLIPNSGVLKETQQIRPVGSALTPQIIATSNLINSFEAGDARRSKWIDSVTYSSNRYYYPAKYRNISTVVTEYYTVLRLAEQYLVRAEARINQSKLTEGIEDINVLRSRAGLANLPANLTQNQLVQSIEQERKTELFSEWGHRWFDLKRTGKANDVLKLVKTRWQTTDILYPIPIDEILSNPGLIQNEGY